MTKDDIVRMAREAGGYEKHKVFYFTIDDLERFAALVIANHPPQSSMAWQEGNEAGRLAEREACAKVCEEDGLLWGQRYADAIRARGNT